MSVTIPGFPAIRVFYDYHYSSVSNWATCIRILYYGWPEDLLAAGVATREMLGPRLPGKNRRRIDAAGERYLLERYWRLKNGQPQRYCKLYRARPLETLAALPGAREAIAEYLRTTIAESTSGPDRRWAEEALRALTRAAMPPALRQLIADCTGRD